MGKRRGGPDHKLSIDKEEATQKNTVKGQPRRRQSGRCKESKLSNQQQSEGAEADGTCPVPSMSYLIRHDSGRWRPDTTRKRRVRDFIDHIVQPERNTELKCKIQILFFFLILNGARGSCRRFKVNARGGDFCCRSNKPQKKGKFWK